VTRQTPAGQTGCSSIRQVQQGIIPSPGSPSINPQPPPLGWLQTAENFQHRSWGVTVSLPAQFQWPVTARFSTLKHFWSGSFGWGGSVKPRLVWYPPATDVQVRRTPGSGEPYVRAVIKQRAEGEFTSHESAGVRGIVEKGTCFPLEQK
jgi:hypothetical protein